ncbi:MAG: efflux RND transporter periplasmic adaptor subunit [Cyanobacteria bacterium P01_D01_bin.128]
MSSSNPQATPAPGAASTTPSAPSIKSQSSTGWQSWLWGILGALLLIGGGFLLWRLFGPREPQGPPMGQGVPVKLQQVQTGSVADSDEYLGSLEAQTGVVLQSEVSGRVTQVFVASGDRVTAGQPIAQISPDRTQAEVNAAQANVNLSRASRESSAAQLRSLEARRAELLAEVALQEEEYRRTAELVDAGALPEQQLDIVTRDRAAARASLNSAQQEIAAAQSSLGQADAALAQAQANADAVNQDLSDRTITAPIDGIVGDVPLKLGDYVSEGSSVTTITQNAVLELEIAVPIEQAEELELGLPVELLDAGGNPAVTGSITFISPTTDPDTQTVLAKARFENTSGRLQDSQRVEVRIIWSQDSGILVPTAAITRLGGQTFVYVVETVDPSEMEADGPQSAPGGDPSGQNSGPMQVAKLRPVQLGAIQGNQYPVLDGLSAGETIVASGILNLQDGMPVVPQSEAEQPGAEQPGADSSDPAESGGS